MINKDSLKARVNNISNQLNISQNVIYNRFFYDAFLSRLTFSPFKDKLILKGGLYLSSVFGVELRSTIDIDFYCKNLSLKEDEIIKVIKEISDIDFDDQIVFKLLDINKIRDDDIYGGFQVTLLGKLDNIRCQFSIDIATGDPIIPSEHSYNYKCLVTGEVLPIKVYSLESVVAEKLETVLSKGIANSRSKDYYDLYILRNLHFQNIDKTILKEAYRKVCEYRHFNISKENALELLNAIKNNEQIIVRWRAYGKRVKYADGISLDDVITFLKEWIEVCFQ